MNLRRTPSHRTGLTALQCAVLNGDLSEMRHLLDNGDNPSDTNYDGWTALHFAAEWYRPDMVALLLERGAIVDALDMHGNTPLNRAVFNSRGRGEVIALLRAAGAHATLNNRYGINPLKMASTISNYNVLQFFADLEPSRDEQAAAVDLPSSTLCLSVKPSSLPPGAARGCANSRSTYRNPCGPCVARIQPFSE